MKTRSLFALAVVGTLIAVAGPAAAQDAKDPKGVMARGLVTSLGGFRATVNTPIALQGSSLEIEPGGHTGRQRYAVPTFVYVVDGILTTDYEAGPVGMKGAQYHAAGQSFMDSGGAWHNYFNRSDKPVKVILLHIGYPGSKTIERPEPE